MKKLNFNNKLFLSTASILTVVFYMLMFFTNTNFFDNAFAVFFVLVILRVIEQLFLTDRVFQSDFKLYKKIIFVLLNYVFIIFTPVYVWYIYNKQIEK